MFWVYILYSEKTDRYYVGQTNNITDRLERHNEGRNKATKAGMPWVLVHTETYGTRSEAVQRETQIKARKSRKYIVSQLHG
jgi:putative endonuclease